MKLEFEVEREPEDVSDARDGSCLLATIRIGAARHHLTLLRVVDGEDGLQGPENEEYRDEYEKAQGLFDGKYETCEVPGFRGQYIAYMTPFS
jgi:hypothetical protein